MGFNRANQIKCPKCRASGRMSLSPQRDSGWCEACHERSELAPRPTRWSRRRFFEGIGVTSGLITIGDRLWRFLPKRHHVNLAATVSGRTTVDIAVLKPAPATFVRNIGVIELRVEDGITLADAGSIAVQPEQG
jgi:hypothetical protein